MRKVVSVRFASKVFGQPASFSAGFKTQDIVTNCVLDPLRAAGKGLQSSRSKGLASLISFGSQLRWRFGHAEKFEEGALKDLPRLAPSAPNSPVSRISPKPAEPVTVYITALARPPSTSRAWPIPAILNEPSEKIA
jgi:hypothetical protein